MKNLDRTRPGNENALKPYQGLRFVVADDQFAVREAIANYLGHLGAEVIACRSAQQCFAAVRTMHPDLILVDLRMPEHDGLELISDIRSLLPEQGARVPAVAFSFYAGDAVRTQALNAGFQWFLAKPFDAPALLEAIDRMLGRPPA